jgi:hypothetical protein
MTTSSVIQLQQKGVWEVTDENRAREVSRGEAEGVVRHAKLWGFL